MYLLYGQMLRDVRKALTSDTHCANLNIIHII